MRALLFVLVCSALVAADWTAAQKRFRADYRKDASVAERTQALRELAGADVPQAAETLVSLWASLEKSARKQRKELYQVRAKVRALHLKARAKPRQAETIGKQIDALEKRDVAINTALAAVEIEQAAIREGLAGMKSDKVVAWIAERGLRTARAPVLVETMALKLDVGGIVQALTGAKKADRIIPLLRALPRHGTKVAPAVPNLLALLGHRDWAVRVAAAHALAASAQPDVVLPMIRRLAREIDRSRAQAEIARALTVLTGKNIGPYPEGWLGWWRANEAKIKGGAITLGRGKPTAAGKKDQGRFYGIPQAERVIYVVDKSGSMEVSMHNPKFEGGDAIPARDNEDRRYDAATRELMKALRQLRPGTEYAVILYSSHVAPLTGDKLVKSAKGNVDAIGKALEHEGPQGSTNIYEALDYALRIAGVHPDSPPGPAQADAIFLISDGSPTDAKGKAEDPERTLQAVRTWNAHQRVAIHAIGIGKQHNSGFLEQLAHENGGRYHAVKSKGKR